GPVSGGHRIARAAVAIRFGAAGADGANVAVAAHLAFRRVPPPRFAADDLGGADHLGAADDLRSADGLGLADGHPTTFRSSRRPGRARPGFSVRSLGPHVPAG